MNSEQSKAPVAEQSVRSWPLRQRQRQGKTQATGLRFVGWMLAVWSAAAGPGPLVSVAAPIPAKPLGPIVTCPPVFPPPMVCQEVEPSAQPGPLDEVGASLREAIGLEFNGGELQTRFPDQVSGQALYTELLRFGGGGGSSAGGNNWRYHLRGNKLSGVFGNGSIFPTPASDRPVGSYFHLVEKQPPFRQVHLESSGKEIQILAVEPTQGTVLRLRQAESGAVLLQLVSAEGCDAYEANSFTQLWFEQSTVLGQRFFPLLRKLGVDTPAVDLTEKLQAQVLNDLAYGAVQQADFLKEFRDLEAEDFETRSRATERLEAEFSRWSLAIARGIRNQELKAEIRARLRKVYAAQASADEKATAELMDRQMLDSNPQFLVQLLGDCRSPEESQLVRKRLREIAQQDLGEELERWQLWAKKLDPNPAPTAIPEFAPTRALRSEANYFRARPELARLVRLTADDTLIRLDREFWKERFGGKSIAELAEGIRAQYKATNLPPGWLNLGDGYDLDSTDYPQVLFEELVDRLVQGSPYAQSFAINRRHQAANRPKSLNREFDIQTMSGELELHPENRAQPSQEIKEEYFRLNLRELSAGGGLLTLEELPKGAFSLCFVDQASDIVLLISQRPNQPARVGAVQGASSWQLENVSPLKLFQNNQQLVADKLVPLLTHAGIDLDGKLGGPLKIEATRSESK